MVEQIQDRNEMKIVFEVLNFFSISHELCDLYLINYFGWSFAYYFVVAVSFSYPKISMVSTFIYHAPQMDVRQRGIG